LLPPSPEFQDPGTADTMHLPASERPIPFSRPEGDTAPAGDTSQSLPPELNAQPAQPTASLDEGLPVLESGRYEIEGEFARGGLGRILRAKDKRLKRPVALKELLQTRGHARERFLREALVTARLQHPGIVPIYEAGVWPSGEPFYAMKLVSGRSLDK